MSVEDGTNEHWGPLWNGNNLQESVSTQVAADGTHSLRLQAVNSSHPPAVGTTHISGVRAGTVITAHIWYGGQGQGQIQPVVQDEGNGEHLLPAVLSLPADVGWHTVTFTIPNVVPQTIGIQVDAYGDSDTVVFLDAVAW
jgi:hypothetical protein